MILSVMKVGEGSGDKKRTWSLNFPPNHVSLLRAFYSVGKNGSMEEQGWTGWLTEYISLKELLLGHSPSNIISNPVFFS